MIMGGDDPATNTVEIIDLSLPTPAWRMIAPMCKPRIQMNAVILPTGKVLALGGEKRAKPLVEHLERHYRDFCNGLPDMDDRTLLAAVAVP